LSLAPLIGPFNLILNLLFLVEQGLLDSPVLYLSRAIIQRKLDYYRLLRSVTSEGRWEDWILYMLNAVDETARWTTAKIRAIRELMQTTAEYVREKAPAVYRRELVELIFVQPYCRIANVVEADIAKRQTASVYLKELCDVGVLKEIKIGREKLFINPRLMTLLTAERDDAVPGYAKKNPRFREKARGSEDKESGHSPFHGHPARAGPPRRDHDGHLVHCERHRQLSGAY
jgi:hypothetical protein